VCDRLMFDRLVWYRLVCDRLVCVIGWCHVLNTERLDVALKIPNAELEECRDTQHNESGADFQDFISELSLMRNVCARVQRCVCVRVFVCSCVRVCVYSAVGVCVCECVSGWV